VEFVEDAGPTFVSRCRHDPGFHYRLGNKGPGLRLKFGLRLRLRLRLRLART